jgi:flagellar biosynthesis anti-sigma factor FlgM
MSEFNPSLKVERKAGITPSSNPGKKQAKSKSSSIPQENDRVSLSPASRVSGDKKTSEIRRDMVEKFKTVLGNGAYTIKADEIADKMVQKIRENKGPSIF